MKLKRLIAAGIIAALFLAILIIAGAWWFLLILLLIGIGFPLLVYFQFAPNNFWCTLIIEGTVKAIMKGGKFERLEMQREGYAFDDEENVVPVGEYTQDGKVLKEFREVKDRIPVTAEELRDIEGFSPSKIESFLKQFQDKSLGDLEQAARTGRIRKEIKGFGERAEEKILEVLRRKREVLYKPVREAVPTKIEVEREIEEEDGVEKKEKIVNFVETRFEEVPEEEAIRIEEEVPHPLGGFRVVAPYPPFEVGKVDEPERSGLPKTTLESLDVRELDYISLKDQTHVFTIEEMKDKAGMDISARLVLVTRVINPRKALFAAGNWFKLMMDLVEASIRNAMTRDTYDFLIAMKEDIGEDVLGIIIEEGILENFRKQYGVEILSLAVQEIEPPPDYEESILEERRARRKRRARKIEGEAEAQYKKEEAKGEAKRIDEVYNTVKKYGALGKLIRVCEAAEKSPLASSLSVQAVPGLQEAFRGVFGKPAQEATPTEREQFKELAEEVVKKALREQGRTKKILGGKKTITK